MPQMEALKPDGEVANSLTAISDDRMEGQAINHHGTSQLIHYFFKSECNINLVN